MAAELLELRRQRSEHLPALLLGEDVWGLLLVLFIADAAGERFDADEACCRAGKPAPLFHRWLDILGTEGLVARAVRWSRHEIVTLKPKGLQAVEACMQDALKFCTRDRNSVRASYLLSTW